MGLLKPLSGRIEIFGARRVREESDFTEVRRRIGLLFQDADDQLFSPTVLEDVAFGPLNLGKPKDEAIAIARRTLAFLGLDGFEDRITFKLSGGEKRLVSLGDGSRHGARGAAAGRARQRPRHPDAGRADRDPARLDLSYILISHELDFLTATTDTVYTMQNGKIRTDQELSVHQHVHAHPIGSWPHEHPPPDAEE